MATNKIYYKLQENLDGNKILKLAQLKENTIIIGTKNGHILDDKFSTSNLAHLDENSIKEYLLKEKRCRFDLDNLNLDIENYEFKGIEYDITEEIIEFYSYLFQHIDPYYLDLDRKLLFNSMKVLSVNNEPLTISNFKKIFTNKDGIGNKFLRKLVVLNQEEKEIYSWFSNDYYTGLQTVHCTKTYSLLEHFRRFFDRINLYSERFAQYILLKNLLKVLKNNPIEATIVFESLDSIENLSNFNYGDFFKNIYYLCNYSFSTNRINILSFVNNIAFLNNYNDSIKELIMSEHDLIDLKDTELYSGEIKLRVPKILHKELVNKASLEGVSLNQYLLYLITKNNN